MRNKIFGLNAFYLVELASVFHGIAKCGENCMATITKGVHAYCNSQPTFMEKNSSFLESHAINSSNPENRADHNDGSENAAGRNKR
ncbi:hypothetical protein Nepgr_017142 [Nepenthes gracilis]|uniref:Uncharacterized protein n=1 Tax=Nepenthes gracilis TaxID=150966 RepID=A0AAD3XT10_NEPGR|nr:hypothetical protein Nepgr_017142 [Nepenthes gracilis]